MEGRATKGGIVVTNKVGKGRVFVCPFEGCRKESTRKYNIQTHMRIHTDHAPYVCCNTHCGMSFKWRSSLANHERHHHSTALKAEAESDRRGSEESQDERTQPAVAVDAGDSPVSDDERERLVVAVILAHGLGRSQHCSLDNNAGLQKLGVAARAPSCVQLVPPTDPLSFRSRVSRGTQRPV